MILLLLTFIIIQVHITSGMLTYKLCKCLGHHNYYAGSSIKFKHPSVFSHLVDFSQNHTLAAG